MSVNYLIHFMYTLTASTKVFRHSIVEHSLEFRWFIRSIPHKGLIKLCFIPASVFKKPCCIYCQVCGMVHIKDPLLLIGKSSPTFKKDILAN